MRRRLLPVTTLLGLALITSGCGADDGANVTQPGATGTASAGTGSGGSAASGARRRSLAGTTDNPLVLTAVTEYKAYAIQQIDDGIRPTTVFTDAVRAGTSAPLRLRTRRPVPWERIEPLAGLVEEIDGAVDARVDDFASVDDPEFNGVAPAGVPAVRAEHDGGRRSVRRPARRGPPDPEDGVRDAGGARRSPCPVEQRS